MSVTFSMSLTCDNSKCGKFGHALATVNSTDNWDLAYPPPWIVEQVDPEKLGGERKLQVWCSPRCKARVESESCERCYVYMPTGFTDMAGDRKCEDACDCACHASEEETA